MYSSLDEDMAFYIMQFLPHKISLKHYHHLPSCSSNPVLSHFISLRSCTPGLLHLINLDVSLEVLLTAQCRQTTSNTHIKHSGSILHAVSRKIYLCRLQNNYLCCHTSLRQNLTAVCMISFKT